MIAHAMKYVGMADRVRRELPEDAPQREGLEIVVAQIVQAEKDTVQAYRAFRALLRQAAEQGSRKAQQYLEDTTWDLT